jgi:hypothetical protein
MIMNLRVIKDVHGRYLVHNSLGCTFTPLLSNATIFNMNDYGSRFVHDMYCNRDISYRSVPIEIKEV